MYLLISGTVYRQSKNIYALKIINKDRCKGKEHMIQNEVNILRRIKHDNIIQLIEDFDVDSEFYLVMELVQVMVDSPHG